MKYTLGLKNKMAVIKTYKLIENIRVSLVEVGSNNSLPYFFSTRIDSVKCIRSRACPCDCKGNVFMCFCELLEFRIE